MARPDLSERSVQRFEGIASSHIKKGETVEAALPVWLGGTYLPFFLGIVIGVMIGSFVGALMSLASPIGAAAGGILGGFAGRYLAKRRAEAHPVDATRLQVYLAITDRRILVHENGSMGKPGGVRADLQRKTLTGASVRRGGFFRPTQLTLDIAGTPYTFEYSGLWRVPHLLAAVGAE